MSANLATILAIAVSLAGIVLLAVEDAKRRRAFDLPPRASRALRLVALLLIVVPPLALLARQETAPIVLWIGALSAAGWVVAMRRPNEDFDRLAETIAQRLDVSPAAQRVLREVDRASALTGRLANHLARVLRIGMRAVCRYVNLRKMSSSDRM